MTNNERYEKIAKEFLNKMTEQQESRICEVVENYTYEDSMKLLSKEFHIPHHAFCKVYSHIRQSGKTRDKRTNRWSNAEIDNIKKMVESGHSILEIASSLSRHPDTMKKKVKEIYGCIPVIGIEGEIWKKIEDSNYEISNFGRFRRVGQRRIIAGGLSGGYIRVRINGVSKSLHRLVAKTFIPNPEGKEMVDHIDGNRTNNHFSNLRWVTAEENSNNNHRLKLLTEKAEKRRIEKEIDNHLKCIFEKGISKLELMRRVLDYKED